MLQACDIPGAFLPLEGQIRTIPSKTISAGKVCLGDIVVFAVGKNISFFSVGLAPSPQGTSQFYINANASL